MHTDEVEIFNILGEATILGAHSNVIGGASFGEVYYGAPLPHPKMSIQVGQPCI